MNRRFDISVVGLYILDILGRPVTATSEGSNVDFTEETRLTVAGTAGGATRRDLVGARPETRAFVEPLLPHVDYFIPSIGEAEMARWRA